MLPFARPEALTQAAQAPGVTFGVGSEVGTLRCVITHRPGLELTRLTPENRQELLFDDVVWTERAVEEHDAFTDIMRQRGVEVLYVKDLLSDVLEQRDAREGVLARTLSAAALGPDLASAVAGWLRVLPAPELSQRLIGGIAFNELPFSSQSLTSQLSRPEAFVLPPLPNQMFTRDTSTWVSRGVLTHPMATRCRRGETIHLEAIYRHHPRFASRRPQVWNHGSPEGADLEGGDILVLGESTLIIGMGERTSPGAVELYARHLFAAEIVDEVIAVVLPRGRASIHLDTVLTMVDVDAFMLYAPIRDALDAYVLRPKGQQVTARPIPDLFGAVSRAIDRPLRLIHGAMDPRIARREQWDEGANLLALAPGTVVAYERNRHANASLRQHGIEVLTVPANEIARGRGGPHCLTCPVARDPV